MQPSTDCDALILGAGPAGATAALLLARAGWRVAIVEKSAFPRRKVCGEFISAATLPLFAKLGIDEPFLASAGPDVRRVGLFVGETILEARMPRGKGENVWGRALGRENLDAMLLAAATAAGAQAFQPWKALSLTKSNEVWTCNIEGGGETRELSAPMVIAATGSWERSPSWDPTLIPHREDDLLGFKAHFTKSGLADDLMPLLVFPGGYGGMVHSDGGRVSLSCCIRRDVLRRCREEWPGKAGDAVVEHIRVNAKGVRQALMNARLEGAVMSAGPIRPGLREPYADGVFAIGNRAGEAHPVVAEGISMAIQAAWLLCRRLIATRNVRTDAAARDAVGAAYRGEWRRQFAPRIHAAALFANLAMRPATHVVLRPVLKSLPGLLTVAASISGKVNRLPTAP
jgi:flavin-dependent dehydrogenase